ncbi:MAG: HNH endonuclease [Microbacteriaceae bacterium]|nr:HNH endonuclease [Microbacteriaceae bacterium]MCL2794163.1 HNH endonuclease [Microbacteriaceae bacterium]
MPSVLEQLRELAGSVASSIPAAGELTSLSATEEAEALRVLGSIRTAICEPISLLAADIQRKSERALGTAGLAQRNGFKDGIGFIQDALGGPRDEAARLVREGALREAGEQLTALMPGPLVGTGVAGDGVGSGTNRASEIDGDSGAPDSAIGRSGMPGGASIPTEPSIAFLRALPGPWDAPVAVALRCGWLSASQADALRRGLGTPRSTELEDAWRSGALDLIADTWAAHWCPEDLARAARRLRACLDTVAAAAEAQQRYEQRSLRRFVRASGMVHYDLELDPESDARLYGPIKRLLSPRFGGPRFTAADDIAAASDLEADPRTNEQLQVDTLIELVDRAVNCDNGQVFKTREPQVMVAVTSEELRKAVAGEPGIAFLSGRDEPITAVDALRMICTGGFTPILFDETGQAIDVGKDQRYFTGRQRKAMTVRDGGCMYPGCNRPPEDCEAHHINPWAQHPSHRTSEVRDGILLCRRHHKLIHDHGAAIRRNRGEYLLHWPGRPPVRLLAKSGIQTQLAAEGAGT